MARFVSRISEIVRKVKPDGDPIMFSKQIQHVGQFMVEGCRTDAEIRALFQELNQLALQNEDAAINLAHILTSRFMETIKFQQSQTTVRNEVLRILQGNFASKSTTTRPSPDFLVCCRYNCVSAGDSSCIIQKAVCQSTNIRENYWVSWPPID